MKTKLGVLVDRLVVIISRLARVFQLEVEIADAVVDPEVRIIVALLLLSLEDLQPRLNRPLRVLGLEGLGAILELLEFRHGLVKIGARLGCDKANPLSRRQLRDWPPANRPPRANRRRHRRRHPPQSPAPAAHARPPSSAPRRR